MVAGWTARSLLAAIPLLSSGCTSAIPRMAACTEHLGTPIQATAAPTAALAMVGFDFGPRCAATVVHVDDRSAHLVAARHCLVRPPIPLSRARVYVAREDKEGPFWEPRTIRRVWLGAGGRELEQWEDFAFDRGDWALVEVDRDETMVAIPLADAPLREHLAAQFVTVRPQDQASYRPCPHARGLEWGEIAALGMGGYSGAAIVANGRVHGIFVGYLERGLFRHLTELTVVPAESIPRPWVAAVATASPTAAVARP